MSFLHKYYVFVVWHLTVMVMGNRLLKWKNNVFFTIPRGIFIFDGVKRKTLVFSCWTLSPGCLVTWWFCHFVIFLRSAKKRVWCRFPALFCTTPPFSCFLPPALQVPLSGVVKKSCVFYEKNLGKILSVRGIVVPLHSLSENFRGQGLEKVFFEAR